MNSPERTRAEELANDYVNRHEATHIMTLFKAFKHPESSPQVKSRSEKELRKEKKRLNPLTAEAQLE